MMARTSIVMGTALLLAGGVAGLERMHCSSACQSCCPRSKKTGRWLKMDGNGRCVDTFDGSVECRLAHGLCRGPAGPDACDEPPLATMRLEGAPADLTFVREGMDLWETRLEPMGRGRLHKVPGLYQNGFRALVPRTFRLPGESAVVFECPNGPSGNCDVAAFLYECHPCNAVKGDLPAVLLSEGFQRSRCGPTFTTGGMSDTQHPMTVFHKVLRAGQKLRVELPKAVEFVWFAMGHGCAVSCGDFDGRSHCIEGSDDVCVWKRDQCVLNTCTGYGPGLGCDVKRCPQVEFDRQEVPCCRA